MKQSWVRKGQGVRLVIGVAVLAAAAAWIPRLAASSRPSSEIERQQAVEERLRVSESAVLVRAPARHLMGLPILKPPTPRELAVYVGEDLLEVTEVQELGGDETWTVLIYLDTPLTGSEMLSRSALALARAAEALTALGPVELLVAAASDVESRVSPTRTSWTLESALADVALQADNGELGGQLAALRREHLIAQHRSAPSGSAHGIAMGALVEEQTERLSLAVRDRCRTDTCLLLLVIEGFPGADASRGLARELAAARWVVGVVAMQEPARKTDTSSVRPPEARQLDAGVPPGQRAGNAAIVPSRYSQELALEKLDLILKLDSAPLTRIARETGGFLVATPQELVEALQTLGRRLLVWFRQPEDPPDGTIPLRVVFVPRSQELWAPRWWRAREASE